MNKVLIADDDSASLKILQVILESNGYQTFPANDGLMAWELLNRESDIRLAILDWMMPGMDGVEICSELQKEHRSSFIYTILLTAKDGADNIAQALHAGANDYVT